VKAVLVLSVLAALAGGLLHGPLGPPDTFWTVDNGGKALVLENLRAGRLDLAYPGASLDPDFRLFPQPIGGAEPYASRQGDRVLSQYASPFVWLTLPFAALLGFAGLGILPALGAGVAVWAAGRLARALGGDDRDAIIAAVLTGLASPLLFYAAAFWEHSLTAALVGLALLELVRNPARPWAAGLFTAGACLLREELVLLLPAIAAGMIVAHFGARSTLRFLAGAVAGPVALALFHRATTGSWLGPHVAANPPAPFAHAADAVSGLLLSAGFTEVPVILSAFLAAAVIAVPRLHHRLGRVVAPTAMLGLGAIAALAWFECPGPADAALALRHSNSVLIFLPWTLVLPFSGPAPARSRVPVVAIVVFVGLFCLLVPARSITGIHPGPRMLLPLLPAAAALAAVRLGRASRATLFAALPLIVVACLWGAQSISLLRDKRELAAAISAAIAAQPQDIVATDLFWVPTELSPLWKEKRFYLLGDSESLQTLATRARAAGDTEILAIVAPGRGPGEPHATVSSPRFPDFSVELHVLNVGGDPVE